MCQGALQRGVELGITVLRPRGLHRSYGLVLEDPGRLARAIAHDDPTRDVPRVAIDLRQPERGRVRQRHVAVEAVKQDRVVGGDGVDPAPVRERGAGPAFVIPVAADDPLARLPLGDEGRHPLDELALRVRGPQVHAGELEAAIEEVQVAIHESRGHQPIAIGEHPRARAHQPHDLGAVAHRGDGVTRDGDRAGPRPGGVAGPDPAVDHEVGGAA
jgi:hypothetical protein